MRPQWQQVATAGLVPPDRNAELGRQVDVACFDTNLAIHQRHSPGRIGISLQQIERGPLGSAEASADLLVGPGQLGDGSHRGVHSDLSSGCRGGGVAVGP